MVQLEFKDSQPVKITPERVVGMWRDDNHNVRVNTKNNPVGKSAYVSGLNDNNKPKYNFWLHGDSVKFKFSNSTNTVKLNDKDIGNSGEVTINTDSTIQIGMFILIVSFETVKEQEKMTQRERKSLGQNMNRDNSRGLSK